MRAIYLLFALIIFTSCTNKGDPEFMKLCESQNGEWMNVEPMKDGKQISAEKCWGCMPDMDNHICSKQEFIEMKEK